MVRKWFNDGGRRVGMETRERPLDFSMQRDALSAEQLGVDRLAREGVAERKAVGGFLDDQLRGDELFDVREERLLVVIGERLQELEIEAPARDSGRRRHRARRGGERIE